jgi:hypothetical protein
MVGISNELIELFSVILQVMAPVVGGIATWFFSKNQDVFNTRKIQRYNVWDYQYTVFFYHVIYSIFNPIIFILGFFFANWVAVKLETYYYIQLMFFIEIYLAIIVIILMIQSEILSKRREKLKIISSSISEEFSEAMLNVNSKKSNVYKMNMLFFSIVWLIFIIQPNEEVIKAVAFSWLIYYLISIMLMQRRLSKYKTKAKIKSKTIIRMDYRKNYGCYCNIVLKKEFSFKLQDNNIIIYFPGDVSSYTIKQDNFISIIVGYRVEYYDENENKYILKE